jgi:purine-binding chemotaxis protein CheW
MNPLPAAQAADAPAEFDPAAGLREFLAFRLGAEEYGVDILRVHEIRSYERPTRIAGTPEFVKGVINLRGMIVPIVDLRLKLQLQAAQYDAFTVVIVLQVGARVMGMVVDAVCDVIALQPEQLRPAPALRAGPAGEHLMAIGAADERMLILVDIDKLIGGADLGGGARTLQ